ncbi:hypothetical protein VIGAN_05200700 [Vigna angularis var. angularis]|uniref:Uncharacterized protein n=1 Tax=Vigna angularis var. angularis TaxID=157739 RepID=A0A0S3S6Q4_PHAAN|nr:hypothetical protein VIGAN_05200700 [Vigna angularis var. angularis]
MKDVIRLSNRLGGKPEKEVGDLRRNLFPTTFSFFVGSTFEGVPRCKMNLAAPQAPPPTLPWQRNPWCQHATVVVW